ncbi:hypothetical protein Esi_0000_0063 [Ectocarpus siliculosus]|uniref:Uncharacterized protein n=1 Tax=Ectocarpus siliculosus TaxID=2880 RepID=D8LAW7_ECTSI|nr:hypothetical protein Esi_0000_0063 [Ectocarpus siliculosus]|eukprot:CBN76476.1 hypothetical protein Esi_0000_0063 [Ectocarpus siliculosus]
MNFFGKGKKGGKKRQQPGVPEPAIDFSSPDAFSEENMAKMSGVDTVAFDENDPSLMAELAELGWGGDDSAGAAAGGGATVARPPAGHRPRPDAAPGGDGGLGPSAAPRREASGNDLLRSLGLSLNSLGDQELTEDDLQDADLLGELGEVSGGAEFDAAAPTNTAEGETGGEYEDDDDDEAVEPDRESESEVEEEDMLALGELEEEPMVPAKPALPPRQPASTTASSRGSDGGGGGGGGGAATGEMARLEQELEILRHRALELKKAGDRAGALEAMRAARSADHELAVMRTLETARKVATVRTEYVPPPSDEEEDDDEAPTPSPAGAGAGGGGGKPVSAELVMKQVKILYQRAIELKKEGRKAEAMACLKRAKSLEADLRREAQGKGLVGSSEETEETEEGGDGGKRPSFVRQASARSRRSSLAAADAPPSAARAESRSGSRSGLPPSVKPATKPKVFPAERDPVQRPGRRALCCREAAHGEGKVFGQEG